MAKHRISPEASQISIMVEHSREGRFVRAFCPLCDQVEETPAFDQDHAAAAVTSIAIIRQHLRGKHCVATPAVKITLHLQRRETPASPGRISL